MILSDKLIYMKKLRRMTNEDISLRAGVPLGTVNKICAGQTRAPSSKTLLRIATALGAPIRYLLDADVPTECNFVAYAEACGVLFLNQEEVRLVQRLRGLSPRDRRSLVAVLNSLDVPAPPPAAQSRQILCYVPIARGQRGVYGDVFRHKCIQVPDDAVHREADFAFQIIDGSMEPFYPSGTILLCRRAAVGNHQLGLFLLNRECYVRKLQLRNGKARLISPNLSIRDIVVQPGDEFSPLGLLLGMARQTEGARHPCTTGSRPL